MTIGGGISFSGLASGLDTAAIIDALVGAERVPIRQLEARQEVARDKINLIGTFEGHVKGLQDAAKALSTLDAFFEFNVTLSDPGVADISVSSGAEASSHTLEVLSLASNSRIAFNGVSNADLPLTLVAGTIAFDYGGQNHSIEVGADQSLTQIASAINSQAGEAVTATVVNTGPASNPSYQLVLTGKDTGAAFAIQNLTSDIAGLTETQQLSAARDAVAIIDGLTVNRESNDFSDVVPGVNIQLTSETPFGPETFTVGADVDSIKGKLGSFVEAYNRVIDFANKQNTYSEDGGAGGPLFGDNVLSSITRGIRNVLFNQSAADVAADAEGFGTLRLIGIELDNSGRLSINDATLSAKIDQNLDALADLFADVDGFDNGGALGGDPNYYVDTTADKGLADLLVRELDRLMKPIGAPDGPTPSGVFTSRRDALNAQIKNFDQTIENRERQLEALEANLVRRFTALEELMAQLNAQQSFLDQQLRNLPGFSR